MIYWWQTRMSSSALHVSCSKCTVFNHIILFLMTFGNLWLKTTNWVFFFFLGTCQTVTTSCHVVVINPVSDIHEIYLEAASESHQTQPIRYRGGVMALKPEQTAIHSSELSVTNNRRHTEGREEGKKRNMTCHKKVTVTAHLKWSFSS